MRLNTATGLAQALETASNDGWEPTTDLERGLSIIRARKPIYDRYRNYYDGNHDLRISVEKMRNTFGNLFYEYADNLMPTVVDSMVDRLEVIGFSLESQDKDIQIPLPLHPSSFNSQQNESDNLLNEIRNAETKLLEGITKIIGNVLDIAFVTIPKEERTIADKAWDLWRQCRMKKVQREIHKEACISGESYILIWPNPNNPGKVNAHAQKASQFYIEDDPENPDKPIYAIKAWTENNRVRVTLYYSDRIEKYISIDKRNYPKKENDFERYIVPNEEWPLINPYGRVPAFRFSHNCMMGGMGKSELHDVIPIQDGLNKSMMDLLVAMEFTAIKQRWATGIEIPTDPLTGQEIKSFEAGSDNIFWTANPNARFGQFDSADLNQFIQVHDSYRLEIARISRTPLHYFTVQTGNAPSGAALRTIEKPLVSKCESTQTEFGDVWEDVAEFMLLVAGDISSTESTQFESNWKPAKSEDEKEDLETLVLKKAIGVTEKQLQREAGYTNREILEMEIETSAKDSYENQQMAQEMLNGFDRGSNFGAA